EVHGEQHCAAQLAVKGRTMQGEPGCKYQLSPLLLQRFAKVATRPHEPSNRLQHCQIVVLTTVEAIYKSDAARHLSLALRRADFDEFAADQYARLDHGAGL